MSSTVVTMAGLMALGALVVQNTAIALTMRFAVTKNSGFLPSTAVCCDEGMKLTFCVLMMFYYYLSRPERQGELQPLCPERTTSNAGFFRFLQEELCRQGVQEYMKMCVPALLYTIQKNLLYLALKNLHAVVYQVLSQSKILTTAIFSYLILGRHLRLNQVMGLVILAVGVAAVQFSAFHAQGAHSQSDPDADPLLGIAAVLMVSLTSGFSSVYFEYMLKKSGQDTHMEWSLWVRNIQLASFAFPIALITAFLKDGSTIHQVGFFHGYTAITWLVICLEATGGIFVALVTKYADSILKNFATALAIVVSAAFCALYMGFSITHLFVAGSSMVMIAIFLYSHQPAAPAKTPELACQSVLEQGKELRSLRSSFGDAQKFDAA